MPSAPSAASKRTSSSAAAPKVSTGPHTLTATARDITELRPHPSNPRNGDTDAIADSLRTNGQYRPIVTTKDGTILAGNHTYAAAMELGWTELWTVTLDITPDSPEALRIMLADNRTADLGGYDDALILDLLDTLPTLDGTGYLDSDREAIRNLLDHVRDSGDDLDEDLADKVKKSTWKSVIVHEVPPELFARWEAIEASDDLNRLEQLLDSWADEH